MGRNHYTPEQVEAAFWAKVDKRGPAECWVWTGAQAGSRVAYGVFTDRGRRIGAHRWSHEQYVGPIPDGYEVEHRCHNGLCVNPAHLRAVTHADNERAKTAAGRRPTGVRNLPCPKCGGVQEGRSRRKGGRVFAFCIPCRRAYLRDYHRRRTVGA